MLYTITVYLSTASTWWPIFLYPRTCRLGTKRLVSKRTMSYFEMILFCDHLQYLIMLTYPTVSIRPLASAKSKYDWKYTSIFVGTNLCLASSWECDTRDALEIVYESQSNFHMLWTARDVRKESLDKSMRYKTHSCKLLPSTVVWIEVSEGTSVSITVLVWPDSSKVYVGQTSWSASMMRPRFRDVDDPLTLWRIRPLEQPCTINGNGQEKWSIALCPLPPVS